MKKLLKCGLMFDATSEDCLKKDQAIVIDGNTIVAVGPIDTTRSDDAEVVDLSQKFVMPGLIDTHVHLQFDSAPGEMGGRSITFFKTIPELTIKSMVTANINLMAGFTTIRNMGSIGMSDIAVRNSINSGLIKGPRIFACGTPICASGGHGDSNFRPEIKGGAMGTIINGPVEALAAVRYTLKYGADGVKVAAAGNLVNFSEFEGGFPELTYEEMKVIVDIASANNKICAAHCFSAASIKNAIRAGINTIEHGLFIDQEGLEMMAGQGTYFVPTLAPIYRMIEYADALAIRGTALDNAKRTYERQCENINRAKKMGVRISIGTDASTQFNPHGTNAIEYKLLVEAGLRPAETLIAGTKVNAELLKWQDKIGSIEAGKQADIVAFDSNPMENISALQNCTFVMKDGCIFKG